MDQNIEWALIIMALSLQGFMIDQLLLMFSMKVMMARAT